MRAPAITLVLVSLLFVSCGGGGGGGDDEPTGPLTPRVTGLSPRGNSPNALANSVVQAQYNVAMKAATAETFTVHGSLTGRIAGTFNGGDTPLMGLIPAVPFRTGEVVEVTLTDDQISTDNVNPVLPLIYRFRVAAPRAAGNPIVSTQVAMTSSDPRAVVSGDWDKDGDIDLAVASFANSKLFILANAAGAFTASATIDLVPNDRPSAIAAGDWDSDGDLDLAVVASGPDTLKVLKNESGVFAVADTVVMAPGLDAVAITSGDFDGDGDLDLAVPGTGGGEHRLQLLENGTGAGDFTVHQTVRMGTQDLPTAIASADLDFDGDLDLLVAISGVPTGIRIFANLMSSTGSGDIQFVESTVFISLSGQAAPSALGASDLDGDGDIDIAVANQGTDRVQIIRNDPGLSFVTSFLLSLGSTAAPASLTVGDFDGDGDMDLATVNSGNSTFTLIQNHLNTNGIFAVGPAVALQALSVPLSLATGDFDNDGDMDFAAANQAAGRVTILTNQ